MNNLGLGAKVLSDMRGFRWLTTAAIILLVPIGGLLARLHWAHAVPSRPNGMPPSAVWVPGPKAPLDLTPRGVWVACWLGTNPNADRCELTDYTGEVEYAADYSAVDGEGEPVSIRHLQLVAPRDTGDLYRVVGQDFVPVVRLEDGAILVPSRDVDQFRNDRRRK